MATEIYLQPELEELVIDADKKQEWSQKISDLGLDGQLELTGNSATKAASPYTFMNRTMIMTFGTICPTKIPVEKYNKSVIPIDVLSHIALCRQEGYFKKLEVWYDDKTPDPILVGYIKDGYGEKTIHLIARWGDEIIPYEQLIEKAIRRYTEQFVLGLKELKGECESLLTTADVAIRQLFAGQKNEWQIKPSFPSMTAI